MTVEEKIKQLTDANKELKRLVSEQNLRIQDWISEIRHAHGLLETKEYGKGLADAWEAVRKVSKLKFEDQIDLFEGTMYEMICSKSPTEVIQKLKDWEEKKAEESKINVGDEVISIDRKSVGVFYEPFVVTGISRGEVKGVGSKYTHTLLEKDVRKTGRHFPEIATLMERLKEAFEEF